MAVSKRDVDAFFQGFNGFVSVAGVHVGRCKCSVRIAFVIGRRELTFKNVDHDIPLTLLFVLLRQAENDHRIVGLGLEHLTKDLNS